MAKDMKNRSALNWYSSLEKLKLVRLGQIVSHPEHMELSVPNIFILSIWSYHLEPITPYTQVMQLSSTQTEVLHDIFPPISGSSVMIISQSMLA